MTPSTLILILKLIDLGLTGYSAISKMKLKEIRAEIVTLQAAGEQITEEQVAKLDAIIDKKLEELKDLAGSGTSD